MRDKNKNKNYAGEAEIGPKFTYNQPGLFNIAGKLCVLREEAVSRMNHVDIVLESDFDNLVASKIGTDRCVLSTFANDIGFVGLLPVHAESVFITVYGDGVEREFVSGTD
jgi:hypothetical protein